MATTVGPITVTVQLDARLAAALSEVTRQMTAFAGQAALLGLDAGALCAAGAELEAALDALAEACEGEPG